MANPDRLMAAGLSTDLAAMLGQLTAQSLTATGSTIADGFRLITQNAFFSTVPEGSGCLLPSSMAEPVYCIYNGGQYPLNVYPIATQRINSGAAGAPYIVNVGEGALFTPADNIGWIASSSGGGVPTAPLRYWRKAMANVRTGTARGTLVVIGDSTSMGAGSGSGGTAALTDAYPHGFVPNLATLLNGTVATSFQSICGGQGGAAAVTYPAYDTRVTFGSGWTIGGSATLGATFFAYTNGSSTALGFTPAAAFDRITVWYYQTPGLGTVAVAVDGGATIGTINAGSGAAAYVSQTFNTTLATHAISLTANNDGSLFIGAVITWSSAAPAIDVIQSGWFGAKAADWATSSQVYSPRNALAALAPDLTIFDLTINDSNGGTSVASYKASMASLIVAAQLSGDVLLMVGPPSDTTDATDGTLDSFVEALQELATQYGCAFVNIKRRWVSYAVTDPILPYYDTLHPESLGYSDIAQALYSVLATA